MLADLGVEPTGNALDGALLTDLFRGKAAPLKAALLDQTLIAGLGNIYVCEALWRAGLSPKRKAGTIVPKKGISARAERLADAVRSVIADAVEAGGSSLRDYVHADGSLGYFQKSFSVYDREGEPCLRDGCRGTVTRVVQSGRSTFYCPACQR
jgi:formamidopyrimidine-DNA glycosylase